MHRVVSCGHGLLPVMVPMLNFQALESAAQGQGTRGRPRFYFSPAIRSPRHSHLHPDPPLTVYVGIPNREIRTEYCNP